MLVRPGLVLLGKPTGDSGVLKLRVRGRVRGRCPYGTPLWGCDVVLDRLGNVGRTPYVLGERQLATFTVVPTFPPLE